MPFPGPTHRRHLAPVALVLGAAVALAGCSGGSGSHAAGPTTQTPAAAGSTAPGSTAPGSAAASGQTGSTPTTTGTSTTPSAVAPSGSAQPGSSVQPTSSTSAAVRQALSMTRAVHITGAAWDYKPKHDAVMALLKEHRINAIEVDIKDETGIVNYASTVPLATTIGAISKMYDIKTMAAEIHAAGGRLIGREVVFNDPKLAKWAWLNGHKDEVLQTSARTPWQGTYGSYAFTNFANTAVQNYNIDLAVEAARDGFDDVLYDYVRRPDGDISQMYIPDLTGTPEQGVASFVENTRKAFTAAGVKTLLGASVFGVSATRPKEIAQNITMMAPYLDYVAPMVYPSHWGTDEYGLKDPINHPYDIVQRSLKDFQKDVKGTGAQVVPWLQAFSLDGVTYTPPQVLAQEQGAHDDGLNGFLLWNADADYDAADLPPLG